MTNILKAIIESLVKEVPAWVKGSLLTLSITLTFLHFSGFTYENYLIAQKVAELNDDSILMSYRSNKDGNRFANQIVEEVHKVTGSYGVALFGLEPEYIPKVIHAISRDGYRRFEEFIKVGTKIHISSRLPTAYMQLREGLVYQQDLDNNFEMFSIGIKSVISHPVTYRGITIGMLSVFLEKHLDKYTETEIAEMNGEIRMACTSISEEFYYKEGR